MKIRIKRVTLEIHDLARSVRVDQPRPVVDGVPEDAVLVSWRTNDFEQLVLYFIHPSFQEVEMDVVGGNIPELAIKHEAHVPAASSAPVEIDDPGHTITIIPVRPDGEITRDRVQYMIRYLSGLSLDRTYNSLCGALTYLNSRYGTYPETIDMIRHPHHLQDIEKVFFDFNYSDGDVYSISAPHLLERNFDSLNKPLGKTQDAGMSGVMAARYENGKMSRKSTDFLLQEMETTVVEQERLFAAANALGKFFPDFLNDTPLRLELHQTPGLSLTQSKFVVVGEKNQWKILGADLMSQSWETLTIEEDLEGEADTIKIRPYDGPTTRISLGDSQKLSKEMGMNFSAQRAFLSNLIACQKYIEDLTGEAVVEISRNIKPFNETLGSYSLIFSTGSSQSGIVLDQVINGEWRDNLQWLSGQPAELQYPDNVNTVPFDGDHFGRFDGETLISSTSMDKLMEGIDRKQSGLALDEDHMGDLEIGINHVVNLLLDKYSAEIKQIRVVRGLDNPNVLDEAAFEFHSSVGIQWIYGHHLLAQDWEHLVGMGAL